MIEFSCPQCGREFKIEDAAAGKKGTCKSCNCPVTIPCKRPEPPPVPQAPPVIQPPPVPHAAPSIALDAKLMAALRNIKAVALVKGFSVAVLAALAVSLTTLGWDRAIVFFSSMMENRSLASMMRLLFWMAGLMPSLVGGYVAAANAEQAPVRHGMVMGFILLVFFYMFHLFPGTIQNGWITSLNLLLVVPLAMLGGYLFRLGVSV